MFGSARIESRETAQERSTQLKKREYQEDVRGRAGQATARNVRSRERNLLGDVAFITKKRGQLSHKLTTWSLTLGPKPRGDS